ncbi:MAG: pilus assembly protein, partial [Planctomycetes bacterium]|nr:pilus assembly protein [Planctomycetota bacterium]
MRTALLPPGRCRRANARRRAAAATVEEAFARPRRSTARLRAGERRGAALVELSVCLPVIVLLVFACIEATNSIFLKQALAASAYEGVRVAIRNGGTQAAAEARCEEVLEARRVRGATVEFTPSPTEVQPRGTDLTCTITAPCGENAVGPSWFFGGRTLRASVTMVGEGGPSSGEVTAPAPAPEPPPRRGRSRGR